MALSNYSAGVHGILMITAWMFLASIAIMIARFFRAIPGPRILGVGLWFNFHRLLLCITLGLTIASYIYIFVMVGTWEQNAPAYRSAHPYIGTVVTFLAILNPILALVRPSPESSNRVYYNWGHWAVGMSAWILAMINIAFGMFMWGLTVNDAEIWIFLAFIVEHGVTDMIFTKFQIEDTKRMERFVVQAVKPSESATSMAIAELPRPLPSRGIVIFRYAWLIFYVCDVVGFWIAIVVLMSQRM